MSEIIAIISSPRTGCNSETISRAIAEGAEENGKTVRFVHIKDLDLNPCQACNYCKKNNRCILTDGISELLEDIRKCDGLILSSPLYFGQVCAQYRVFEDRLYSGIGPDGSNIPAGKKIVSVVTCGADLEGSQREADRMNLVFSKYFGGVPVGTMISKDDGNKDAASKDYALLNKAKELGKKF
ncbi:MAG TPA: flavodoxin family protein [Candidatus Methanomethylophilaceae archaeon]|nr:flavodoxin family protein [Candidatus Methanomethylophilaceae archaeon]